MTGWPPLDDQPGPARPIAPDAAQRMIRQALEVGHPSSSARRPRWMVAWVAAALVALSTGAFAAWRPGWIQDWLRPPAPRSSTPVQTDGKGTDATGSAAFEPPTLESTPNDSEAEASIDDVIAEPPPPTPARPPRRAQPSRSVRRPMPSPQARGAIALDHLDEANQFRRAGAWRRAEASYLKVARSSASGAIRQTAWVAVGRLRLERLDDPGGARTAFRTARAVAPDGPLDAEALWGSAQAAKRLDRTDEEKAALRKLVEEHPSRPEAQRARERLSNP